MSEATLQNVSRLSSPALRAFEVNPFRVLRLAPDASTSDAAVQAERVLTLLRAGMPPAGEDVLPWLPPSGTYEAQQAAQTVEEPLARLTEQLLWFDLVRDPGADSLKALLRELTDEALQNYFGGEVGLPPADQCDPSDPAAVATVARVVNQANTRLLVAASLASGFGIRKTDAPPEPRKIARADWQNLHGMPALQDAHSLIAGSLAGLGAAAPGPYWQRGLRRWVALLNHPWFRPYLARCIEDLEDDFVSPDDAETVEEGVRTRLADVASHEMRFLLLGGHYAQAAEMISALAHSGIEKRVLAPALRPIHHLFQSEVAELQALLEGPDAGGLGQLDAYVKRLAAIKRRWAQMDEAGLVGLGHILDDALEQVLLRLRALEKPDAEADALLRRVSQLAGAASLRERANFYRNELEQSKKRLCHFCQTEPPDFDRSVVLEGLKQTGVTQEGNVITTHYMRSYDFVFRCARCARFHDFLRRFGMLMLPWPIVAFGGIGFYLLFMLWCLLFWIGLATFSFWPRAWRFCVNALARVPGRFTTPKGHRRYGDYKDTDGYDRLRREGYDVRPDWRGTAVSKIQTT